MQSIPLACTCTYYFGQELKMEMEMELDTKLFFILLASDSRKIAPGIVLVDWGRPK